MPQDFPDRLAATVTRTHSRVCVGLDPAIDRVWRALGRRGGVPVDAAEAAAAIWEFNQYILEAVAPYCGIIKPQSAFYEIWGPAGLEALCKTVQRAREMDYICILDVKRNDIGSSSTAYAQAYLGESSLSADAITVNPYLGTDGITPFLNEARRRKRGLFVLVKTSNPSSAELQDLRLADGRLLHEAVADLVAGWGQSGVGACGYSDVGAVVGATFPRELAALRKRLPHTWFLVPGYGTQGGTAEDVALAFDEERLGAIVNSSSGIIFAGLKTTISHFALAAAEAACEMRDRIETALEARRS
ncbi:MAG: orotidine-5'-phosphate decarboxylase [Candidatus Zipacnadales bacterium]